MDTLKHFIITYKKPISIIILLLLLYAFSFSTFLYKEPIAKVIKVETNDAGYKESLSHTKEKCFTQNITAKICNGSNKGKLLQMTNEYSHSETSSQQIKKGDRLFVSLSDDGYATIRYAKRDSYLYLVSGIFIFMLLFLFKKRGFMTLLSCIANVLILYAGISFYKTEHLISYVFTLQILLFIVVTLVFVEGFHKKTLAAILSCLVSVSAVFLLYYMTIYQNYDLSYEMMECMQPDLPLSKIYMISVIIGMLGAVMDISVTMTSTVDELIQVNHEITLKALINSLTEIGHDIMGTMVNVLFFSYLSSYFPILLLKFYGGYALNTIFSEDYIFDFIRFLIGSIGIVAAIPISGTIATLLYLKGLVKKS